jgi:predicted transcriptional regulator
VAHTRKRKTAGRKTIAQVIERFDSQAAAAKYLGVTQAAISRWLSGERRPRPAARRRLVALGVDPLHLV